MKEDNWNINTNKVQLWLEQEDRGDNGKAIELSIMLGNNCQDDELRSTYWTAIRSIGSSFDDFLWLAEDENRHYQMQSSWLQLL